MLLAVSRTRSHPVGVLKISTYGLVVVLGLLVVAAGVGDAVALALLLAIGVAVGLADGFGVGVAFFADPVAGTADWVATGSTIGAGAGAGASTGAGAGAGAGSSFLPQAARAAAAIREAMTRVLFISVFLVGQSKWGMPQRQASFSPATLWQIVQLLAAYLNQPVIILCIRQ